MRASLINFFVIINAGGFNEFFLSAVSKTTAKFVCELKSKFEKIYCKIHEKFELIRTIFLFNFVYFVRVDSYV